MTIKDKLVVLDFDDTLYFTFESAREAAWELYGIRKISKGQYDSLPTRRRVNVCYLGHSKYRNRSRLNAALVEHLNKPGKRADAVVITGRDHKLMVPTLDLASRSGLDIKKVYFARDMARHAMTWRVETLKRLARGYGSVDVYDDRRKHIDYIARKVTHKDKYRFFLVRGRRITRFVEHDGPD